MAKALTTIVNTLLLSLLSSQPLHAECLKVSDVRSAIKKLKEEKTPAQTFGFFDFGKAFYLDRAGITRKHFLYLQSMVNEDFLGKDAKVVLYDPTHNGPDRYDPIVILNKKGEVVAASLPLGHPWIYVRHSKKDSCLLPLAPRERN